MSERDEALRLAKEAGFTERFSDEVAGKLAELIRLARQSASCPHLRSSDDGTQYCALAQSGTQGEAARHYRCFHCKQVFTEGPLAEEHFGRSTETMALCMDYMEHGVAGGPHVPFVHRSLFEREMQRVKDLEAKLTSPPAPDAQAEIERLKQIISERSKDADGEPAFLCTVCSRPVQYGSRHSHCGALVMRAEAAEKERDELRAKLEAAQKAVPSNWLDPLLTGPEAIGPLPLDGDKVERLLNAIRARIDAARSEKPA